MDDKDDATHPHDAQTSDERPKGGPVENPSELPDWDPKSVDADGLEKD